MTITDDPFEARLQRVLRDGTERLSVGRAIPALPISPPLSRPGATPRKRVTRRRILGAGVVIGLAVTGTAVAAATSAPPKVSLPPGTKISPAPDVVIQAVTSVLPAGASVETSRHIEAGRTDSIEITANAGDGSQYNFQVYGQFFVASELDGFGLPKSHVSGGTLWVGADSPRLRSVYFLSSGGIGIYVASDSATGHAAPLSDVTTEASRLAATLTRQA